MAKSKKEKEMTTIEYVNNYIKETSDNRLSMEKNWYLYLAFYLGKQWVRWKSQEPILFTPKQQVNGREYITYNKIKPLIDEQVSTLNTNKPNFETVPENSEKISLNSADFCTKLIPYIENKTKNDIKNLRLDNWTLVFGLAYKMLVWNPNKGKVKNGDYEGDLDVEILSPFNILKPNSKLELEDCPKVIILKYRSLEWILDTFPKVKKEDLFGAEGKEISSVFRRVDSILRNNSLDENIIDEDDAKSTKPILVKTMLEKPTKKFPKGRVLVVINQKLVYEENELPYEFMKEDGTFNILEYKYDYAQYQYKYPLSLVENLLDPQKNYNIMISLIHENLRATAKNKLFIDAAADINLNDVANSENTVVQYDFRGTDRAGQPAFYLSGNPMNSDVLNSLTIAEGQLHFASSVSQAMLGQNPPNVRSTSHLMFMVEQATRRMSPYMLYKEQKEAEFYDMALKLMKEKYNNGRLVELVGKDEVINVDKFEKGQINFNSIRVIRGSSAPQSKALQTEYLITLAQTGMMPPELLPTLFSNLGYNDIKRFIQKLDIDTKNAVRENELIEQGLPVTISPYDKHNIHLLEHKNEAISESFRSVEELPMLEPVVMPNPQTGQPEEMEMTRGQYMQMHIEQTAQTYSEILSRQVPPPQEEQQGQQGQQQGVIQ